MFGAGGETWGRALRKQGERPRIEQKVRKRSDAKMRVQLSERHT